ncbi:MAG: hypothetical protein KIS92_01380 [Planctomycetota bacterium]|nr:hypothetical protein [Planctomycetota bacterium]
MRLRDLSIKWKLVTTIMAVSVTAILVSGLILFGYEHDAMEELMERDLGSLARAAAMNTTAALTFDDARAAEDTLSSFSEKPSVEAA